MRDGRKEGEIEGSTRGPRGPKNLHRPKKIYTDAVRGVRDKYQVCLEQVQNIFHIYRRTIRNYMEDVCKYINIYDIYTNEYDII